MILECLREAKQKCRARLYAYVLMTNHVHLLVEPEHEGDLGRFMRSVGRRKLRYISESFQEKIGSKVGRRLIGETRDGQKEELTQKLLSDPYLSGL